MKVKTLISLLNEEKFEYSKMYKARFIEGTQCDVGVLKKGFYGYIPKEDFGFSEKVSISYKDIRELFGSSIANKSSDNLQWHLHIIVGEDFNYLVTIDLMVSDQHAFINSISERYTLVIVSLINKELKKIIRPLNIPTHHSEKIK